jgi:hypothetical protein
MTTSLTVHRSLCTRVPPRSTATNTHTHLAPARPTADRWHFMGGKSYNAVLGVLTLFSTIFSAVTIAGVP